MRSSSVIHEIERHCVFRCGSSWFALPAAVVREIAPRPHIVPVPHSAPALVGVCHLRNEFLPILSLRRLLAHDLASSLAGDQVVVMNTPHMAWALIVDAVAGLEMLEISINSDSRIDDAWSGAVLGSATCRDQIVQVLDPHALLRIAVEVMTPDCVRRHATSGYPQHESMATT